MSASPLTVSVTATPDQSRVPSRYAAGGTAATAANAQAMVNSSVKASPA